jgi:alpha-tubulin suppressor-like RCC1 family protein
LGRGDVSNWRDIIAIATGTGHTVGLRADGTVVTVGADRNGQLAVSDWREIVAVTAGAHTFGLRADGMVLTTDGDGFVRYQGLPLYWTDMVAISVAGSYIAGITDYGSVVVNGSVGGNSFAGMSLWDNIIAISAGAHHLVGLRANGTVEAVGSNHHNQTDVSDWNNIVAILAGEHYTVGLQANGTVVTAGYAAYAGDGPVFMRELAERIIIVNNSGR